RDPAVAADVGGNALERHHRRGTGALRDRRLFRGGDVHDHATLQHLRETDLEPELLLLIHLDSSSPLRRHRAALRTISWARDPPPPASVLSRSTAFRVASAMISTSASSIPSPSEKRTLPCASSAESPIAISTCEGPGEAALPAEPVETVIPA